MENKGNLENALSEIDALRAKMAELTKRKDIHQIELDLLLQKLRELYNFLGSLQSVESMKLASIVDNQSAEFLKTKETKAKPVGFHADKKQETQQSHLKTEEKLPVEDQPEPKHEKNHHQEHHQQHAESNSETNHQKPDISRKSVHETISESGHKQPAHIGAVLHSRPIHNIEDAIGLNDKFLYIKELFSTKADLYKETIHSLNTAADFNEAFSYIEKNFEWDMESETVQKFLDLVKRRHISHKNG